MNNRYISDKARLVHLNDFLKIVCIETGTGYDLKNISHKIILGQYTFKEAINE